MGGKEGNSTKNPIKQGKTVHSLAFTNILEYTFNAPSGIWSFHSYGEGERYFVKMVLDRTKGKIGWEDIKKVMINGYFHESDYSLYLFSTTSKKGENWAKNPI